LKTPGPNFAKYLIKGEIIIVSKNSPVAIGGSLLLLSQPFLQLILLDGRVRLRRTRHD